MSSEINRPRSYFDVHQIVNNSTLNVSFMLVNCKFTSSVENFQKTKVGFEFFVKRLILRFVVFNTFHEIIIHLVLIIGDIVGTGNFDFFDIAVNYGFVIAQRFNEEELISYD